MNDEKGKFMETDALNDGLKVGDSVQLEMYNTNDFASIKPDGSIEESRIENSSKNTASERFASIRKMMEINNNQEALRILATDQNHDAEWHLCIAYIYIRMEHFKEAKENILIAKEYDPDNDKWKSVYKFYKHYFKKYRLESKPKAIAPMSIPDWEVLNTVLENTWY